MANDDHPLASAALLLGGGVAGYAAARFLVERQGRQPMNASPPRTDGPITSPSQVDAQRVMVSGPITSPSQVAASSDTASVALGVELANQLTAEPDAAPRRPSLAATSSPTQTSSLTKPSSPVTLEIGPARVEPTTPSALPRQFDPVFERYRGSIPIEYLRALVQRESGFNANARAGTATGLMQIIPVVLDDYNKRNGTNYLREHLTDPNINVAIGCELLRIIIASYRRNHARVLNLQANWVNPRFVELLTFGWNAGYSEAGGVGRVARYLEGIGVTELTIDRIQSNAQAAGATKHLANTAKAQWSKSVVALYIRERRSPVYRGASWFAVKTPGVILDEMRAAKTEVESLGRDIYASYRRPFEAQLAAVEAQFKKVFGRAPGVGARVDTSRDDETLRSWMQPVPSDTDWQHKSYQGQFVMQWGEFEREFGEFWTQHQSWTDRMWRGTYDKAVEYRRRAGDWRTRFEAMGGQPTTPAPSPPTEQLFPDGISIPWKPIAIVGGLAAAAFVAVPALRTKRAT